MAAGLKPDEAETKDSIEIRSRKKSRSEPNFTLLYSQVSCLPVGSPTPRAVSVFARARLKRNAPQQRSSMSSFSWHSDLVAGNIHMPQREAEPAPPPPPAELLASGFQELIGYLRVAPRAQDGALRDAGALVRGLREHGLRLTPEGAGRLLAICDRTAPSKQDFVHCCCIGTAAPAGQPQPRGPAAGRGGGRGAAPAGPSSLRHLCSATQSSSSPALARGTANGAVGASQAGRNGAGRAR